MGFFGPSGQKTYNDFTKTFLIKEGRSFLFHFFDMAQ